MKNEQKTGILKKVISGAKETVRNFGAARAANKQASNNIINLSIKRNLKKFGTKPSQIKIEMESGLPSKVTRDYLKSRDSDIKKYKKNLGL